MLSFSLSLLQTQKHSHTCKYIPHMSAGPPHPTHVGRRPCSPQSPVCTHISRWEPASLRRRCSTSWEPRTPQRRSRTHRGPPPAPCPRPLWCQGTGPSWAQWGDTSCRRPWQRPERCRRPGPGRPGRSPFCSGCWCHEPPCSASWRGHQHPPVGTISHILGLR